MSQFEQKINKNRVRSSYITVTISMTVVLFMIGLVGLLITSGNRLINNFKESISYEIWLIDDAQESDIKDFISQLKLEPFTKEVRYTSKEKALTEAREELNLSPDDVFYNDPIFNASIQLFVKNNYLENNKNADISKIIKKNKIVESINFPQNDFNTINHNLQKIQWGAIGMALLFLLIAFLLINNAIRLNIYSKRFSIKTMQLIGAKKSFIQKPFLIRSIFIGLISGFLAFLLLYGIHLLVFQQIQLPLLQTSTIYESLILLTLLSGIGVLIAFLSTYFATQKYLHLRTEQLYF